MNRKLCISALMFLATTLYWFASSQQQSSAQNIRQPQLQKWEYQELEMHGGHFDRPKANKLGAKGWELVSAFTPTNRDAVSIAVFKRKRH